MADDKLKDFGDNYQEYDSGRHSHQFGDIDKDFYWNNYKKPKRIGFFKKIIRYITKPKITAQEPPSENNLDDR